MVIKPSTLADVISSVPYLLGFHPTNSFVLIGLKGPRRVVDVTLRYDLADSPDEAAAMAEHATGVLIRNGVTSAFGVGYGPAAHVTAIVDALTGCAREAGIELIELLRVDRGRYWSYTCKDPSCCPAEGVAFDPCTNRVATEMTAAGLSAARDREARASVIAEPTGDGAEAAKDAIQRAHIKAKALLAQGGDGPKAARFLVVEGRRAVAEAIHIYCQGEAIQDEDQLAWLIVATSHMAVRDDAWARMVPAHKEHHLRLWTDVVRRCVGRWTAAPASLLAFGAWQCGDGPLANMAIERALTASPGYSMAVLIDKALLAGLPPSAAKVPITPDEVAASYGF